MNVCKLEDNASHSNLQLMLESKLKVRIIRLREWVSSRSFHFSKQLEKGRHILDVLPRCPCLIGTQTNECLQTRRQCFAFLFAANAGVKAKSTNKEIARMGF